MALVTDLTIHPSFEQAKKLRLGAQNVTLLNTLRDPTQLRRHQCATRQQHPFYGCTLLSSLEHLILVHLIMYEKDIL